MHSASRTPCICAEVAAVRHPWQVCPDGETTHHPRLPDREVRAGPVLVVRREHGLSLQMWMTIEDP